MGAMMVMGPIMKKLSMLGIIGGAALLIAAPFSLQWSHTSLGLSLESAEAQIRQPPTATSVAGVSRRVHRRAYRRAVYGNAGGVDGYGYLAEYISPPALTSYYVPPYSYANSYSYAAPYRFGYSRALRY